MGWKVGYLPTGFKSPSTLVTLPHFRTQGPRREGTPPNKSIPLDLLPSVTMSSVASISAKPRIFSTPDSETLPDGVHEIYGAVTRSSTSRPTILHAYTPLASLPSIQWILDQNSGESTTSTRLGSRHSYQIWSPSKASLHEPSSLLPSRDLHNTRS